MQALAPLLRRVEDFGAWQRLAPGLTISSSPEARSMSTPGEPMSSRGLERMMVDGIVRLDACFNDRLTRPLQDAMAAIRADGLHPVFVFVYDEPWIVMAQILRRLSRSLQMELDALPDFWGWHLDPRTDAGGWSVHRGWYEDVRGEDRLPSLLNVWVSLSEATPRNACMHLVPLGDDPAWPHSLSRRPFQTTSARAMPTRPGDVLAWNANVLHWGGSCDPTFGQVRASLSFSFIRRGWQRAGRALEGSPSFRERLDLVARQFVNYGSQELAESAPVMQWATVSHSVRALSERRSR